jgi:hypothetical protein
MIFFGYGFGYGANFSCDWLVDEGMSIYIIGDGGLQ